MSTILVDTYRLVDSLKQKGFNEQQATGIADALAQLDLHQLVTKKDLKAELATLKADFFKWLVPILLGQAALIAGLVDLFS